MIMLQIENEYGSYGNDKEYLRAIAKIYEEAGMDCLCFTADGPYYTMLSGGTLPEYLAVANFGSKPETYLSVLAANARGRAILSELRRTCPVPLVTKPADAPACRQRELSDRADALYTLAMQKVQNAGFFTRHAPIMTE